MDGTRIVLPERRYKGSAASDQLRFTLPLAHIEGFSNAQRVAGKVCDVRWELDQEDRKALADFVMEFREELSLQGDNLPEEPGEGVQSL